MIYKKHNTKRRGATAVEFALVLPVVFLFVFSIFEISKMMLFEGNVSSAVLVGVRQGSLIDSTPSEVETLIRTELSKSGITQATVKFTPQNFTQNDSRLEITVDAPFSSANGCFIGKLFQSDVGVAKTIEFDREK